MIRYEAKLSAGKIRAYQAIVASKWAVVATTRKTFAHYHRAALPDVAYPKQDDPRSSLLAYHGGTPFVARRSMTVERDTPVLKFVRVKNMRQYHRTAHVETDKRFECRSDGDDVFLLSSWNRLLGKTPSVASLA